MADDHVPPAIDQLTISDTVEEAQFSKRVLIRSILNRPDGGFGLAGQTVKVGGWVKKGREQGKGAFSFLELNDGSCPANLQLMIYADVGPLGLYTPTGTCLHVEGVLQLPPEDKQGKQRIELKVVKVLDVGTVDPAKYPLPKTTLTLEFLRDYVHLRPRTNTFSEFDPSVLQEKKTKRNSSIIHSKIKSYFYITDIGGGKMSSDASSIDQQNNEIPVEDMVMDFTHLFTTQEHFSSRDSLIQWTRAKGKEYGIVIVTGRSDKGWGNKAPRLFLTCERSGRHRGKKSVLQASCGMNEVDSVQQTEKQKGKRKRDSGTKKCGCPFRLKCKQINELGEWALEVMCGVHNHPIAKHMDGHSYVGRLLKPEEEYVTDISHANSKPKDILIALRRKFKDNKSTDTIKDLFFAHPGSIDLLHAFPYVIFMDCTYKTNRYKLPLLEIVGMTSTNLTFLIAVAYMEFEREDNYTWACTILRSLMDESLLPNVIVTDRELALMNAIKTIFPTSSHLLCRWHINKNILANCKRMFSKKERWDLFNMNWNMLVICNTEQDFKDMYTRLFDVFSDFPNALKYVNEQWLVPYKERFVSCWTNNTMHFDNTTTNRVETQHALLKRQLGSSQGNFETCWSQIHTLIEASHIAIKHSFEKSKNVVQFKFNDHLLEGCPLPPVAALWNSEHHECSKGWLDFYRDRLEMYSEVVGKSSVIPNTKFMDLD